MSNEIAVQSLSQDLSQELKVAYSCRNIPIEAMKTLISGTVTPQVGDLVLARVDTLGQHKGIETSRGRRSNLFPGDHIVLSYGNRYAPDQFEAEVPADLSPCSLVAAGGMAAKVLCKHASMSTATAITPVGLVGDEFGKPLNLADWCLKAPATKKTLPLTFAVVGTSMNSGKTTSAANLIRGLVNAGYKVGAAKITGTGAPGDGGFFRDAGAFPVYDFADAGYPSTYRLSPAQIESIMNTLTHHLAVANVDTIVLEIADGLLQPETAALCASKEFASRVDGLIFAAGDAMGAAWGVDWLRKLRLPVLGVSGLLTSSPLASREAETVVGLPVYTMQELSSANIVDVLGLSDPIRRCA
jgi:hypothetical protein